MSQAFSARESERSSCPAEAAASAAILDLPGASSHPGLRGSEEQGEPLLLLPVGPGLLEVKRGAAWGGGRAGLAARPVSPVSPVPSHGWCWGGAAVGRPGVQPCGASPWKGNWKTMVLGSGPGRRCQEEANVWELVLLGLHHPPRQVCSTLLLLLLLLLLLSFLLLLLLLPLFLLAGS